MGASEEGGRVTGGITVPIMLAYAPMPYCYTLCCYYLGSILSLAGSIETAIRGHVTVTWRARESTRGSSDLKAAPTSASEAEVRGRGEPSSKQQG